MTDSPRPARALPEVSVGVSGSASDETRDYPGARPEDVYVGGGRDSFSVTAGRRRVGKTTHGPVTMAMADRFEATGQYGLAAIARKYAIDRPRWWHRFTKGGHRG